MNQFVNPKKRGVELPEGCKDLINVIRQPWQIQPAGPTKFERFTQPDYSVGTFEHMEFQVSRLFISTAQTRFLSILCCEGDERKVVISLIFRNGTLGVTLVLGEKDLGRESAIRALFAASGAQPTMDTVSSTAGGASRLLRFPLPTSAPSAALMIADAFRKGFGLRESSKLFFYYHETLDA